MMKKTLIASALMAASTATVAEISGNVALVSDYVFRGISQTDNQIAIQGGLDYAHDSGLYVGTWASSVDPDFFNGTGHDPQIELDLYAGYSGEIGNGMGYDIGYLRYEYPGFGDADTNEVYASLSYSDFSVSVNYSDELAFLPSDQSAWYWKAAYDTTLPWYEIGFSAHLGYSTGDAFDVSDSDRPADSGFYDSYTDWSLGVSKSVYGVDLGLTYTDLDLDSKDDCDADFCDSKIVFSISKSL
jgi:uncharacterized protein (TIGR02001 family)